MKPALVILALLVAVGCQTQTAEQSVRLGADPNKSYTGEELTAAKALIVAHPVKPARGWKVGVVLAVYGVERGLSRRREWRAVIVRPSGSIQILAAGPYADPDAMQALVSRGDLITWDDRDGDDTVSPPNEIRVVVKVAA